MKRRRTIIVALCALAGCALTGGCNSALETGYQPRKLGAGPAERRAFYSPRLSPEAQAARQEREQEMRSRRPGPDAGP